MRRNRGTGPEHSNSNERGKTTISNHNRKQIEDDTNQYILFEVAWLLKGNYSDMYAFAATRFLFMFVCTVKYISAY